MSLAGELDIAGHALLRRMLFALVEPGADLTIDLAQLAFIDLASIRMLVEFADTATAAGCRLVVCAPSRAVARTLELTATAARLPLAA